MVRKSTELVSLESLTGWDTLEKNEQSSVTKSTESAKLNRASMRQSRLAFGADLIAVREVLMPKGMWTGYCRSIFHMSVATAFRYTKHYEVISKKIEQPLIDFAIEAGYEIPLKALEASRPPKTEDPDEMVRFLERINASEKKKVVVIEYDPNDVLKDVLHDSELGYGRLPQDKRTRNNFIHNYIGMLMTLFGIGHEQSFKPVAIPDHFRVVKGRPRLSKAA
jgi:hypothetical protein